MVSKIKKLVKKIINRIPPFRKIYLFIRVSVIRYYIKKTIKKSSLKVDIIPFEDAWREMQKKGIDCPTHRFVFFGNSIFIPEKCIYLQGNDGEYFIPFIIMNQFSFLAINQINLNREIFLKSIEELIKRYKIREMKTQRTYMRIEVEKIPFIRRDKIISFEIKFTEIFEDYLSQLGKNTRFNLRYYSKKIINELGGQFKVFNEIDREHFRHFIWLVSQIYKENPWEDALKIFDDFKKHIMTFITFIDNQPSAFNIYFKWKDTAIFIGNTFDRKYSKYSLGFINTFWSIRELFNMGFKKVILGPWDQGYKNRLAKPVEMYIYYF